MSTQKIHEVEINLPVGMSKDFMLKIDGQRINGVRNIEIKSPFNDVTTIGIEILANVKGKIQAEKIKITEKEAE